MAQALDIIEDGILQDDPIAALLRKVIVFGGQVQSDALRQWARQELDGYGDGAPVPAYRKLAAGLFVDAQVGRGWVKGQQIEPWAAAAALKKAGLDWEVTPDVEIRPPIAEVQSMAEDEGPIRMQPGWWSVAAAEFDKAQAFQQTTSIYYQVSRHALMSIVDRVKTQLAEFVAELRRDVPREASATHDQVERAINMTFNAPVGTVVHGETVNIEQTVTVQQGDWESLRRALNELGIGEEDVVELQRAAEDDEDPRGEGSKVQSWIRRQGARLGRGSARFGGAAGAAAAGNLISTLVGQYFGWS